MALVPIAFKADSETNAKKGKVRAEDFSALFAFSLQKKTGILDMLNKIEQGGVVVSNGTATVTLHSGYAVICGRPVLVEEGTTHTITLPSGSQSGYFGIKVDLGADEDNECEFFANAGALTTEDLNENPVDGVYEMALYSYTADSSSFTITGKVAEEIKSSGIAESALYTSTVSGTVDRTKTIAEKLDDLDARLTVLGFKDGGDGIIFPSTVTVVSKKLQRVGNFVIGRINCNIQQNVVPSNICNLPVGFRPKSNTACTASFQQTVSGGVITYTGVTISIGADGSVSVSAPTLPAIEYTRFISIMLGFEAPPVV